jgi:hypothetical protein
MVKSQFLISFFYLITSIVSFNAESAVLYVAPNGSDEAGGTISQPFAGWAKAQAAVSAGDTVYFRAGIYTYTHGTTSCGGQTGNVSAVVLNKSGSSGKLIHYLAYPGELPVFDFSGVKDDCRIKGVEVAGNWIHLRGLEIKGVPQNNNLNHESWGVWITGNNNIFEQLNLHHNMGPGLFIQKGEGNLVLNCDSHDNYDPLTSNGAGESSDGFGCHTTTVGTVGNVFRGCRAWWNSDDGFDCITCSSPVLIENCWNWLNGYLPGTTTSSGNGNGFKLGGFGNPPSKYPSNIPVHTIRNCLAFLNKSAGIYQNHHPVPNIYYNNTSFNNRAAGFNLLGYDLTAGADAGMGKLRNNVSFGGTAVSNGSGSSVDAADNSWNISSFTVSNNDFLSVDTSGIYGPRKADGSLPDLKFLRPAKTGKLIDKGIDIGLPYSGAAPDLGAYEYQDISGIAVGSRNLSLRSTKHKSFGKAILYDLSGRQLTSQTASKKQSNSICLIKFPGEHNCKVILSGSLY